MRPPGTVVALGGGVSALLFGEVSESDRKFGLTVSGRLDDPLVGKLAELRRFAESPHSLGGLGVALGPLAVLWRRTGGLTKVVYQYVGWELRLETVAVLVRHPHRRGFIAPAEAKLTGKFEKRLAKTVSRADCVKRPAVTQLEKDLVHIYALHREMSHRVTNIS